MTHTKTQDIEVELLLEALFRCHGYDFRHYSRAHITRRILKRVTLAELDSISGLQQELIHDPAMLETLLLDFSINVTEMFRDPEVYRAIRQKVIPLLATYPFIKIWHAGCSTGEEVYSMAILLREEGLYDRCRIYATDFNAGCLDVAKKGIYSMERLKEYTANYREAGGKEPFSAYYHADYDSILIDQSLKENILFSQHNLVTDGSFGDINLIFCRNVLIYFDRSLKNRVIQLFSDSLTPGGILCIGTKESLDTTRFTDQFKKLSGPERIYRKHYN